jgi:thiopurine S-methyltransferase
MHEVWLERWREGRIGWHEVDGSGLLRRHWPRLMRGSRVLVPFCGKSVDLLWLAAQGTEVVGVEISEVAVRAFFAENDLGFEIRDDGDSLCYQATSAPISLYCGDYFKFRGQSCQALFDRGALVAVPGSERERYVTHTNSLLESDAFKMIITLEYDQHVVAGPPFSIDAAQVRNYWPDIERVYSHNDIETGSPKFRKAGLTEVIESVWTSA